MFLYQQNRGGVWTGTSPDDPIIKQTHNNFLSHFFDTRDTCMATRSPEKSLQSMEFCDHGVAQTTGLGVRQISHEKPPTATIGRDRPCSSTAVPLLIEPQKT
jgi:hypothetical protein